MIGFGKHRRPRDSREDRDRGRARANLAKHICKPRISRAFDFREPGTSHYAFSLTWTPGSLSLAGDCGELTLVHYHALLRLEPGLAWATSSDVDYLLSKSSRREVIDRAGTVRWVVETANERAGDTVLGQRKELQRWRRDKPDVYAWFDPDTEDGYDDWLRARPEPFQTYPQTRRRRDWPHTEYTVLKPEDGFETWEKLRDRFADHLPVEAIYTARGRAEIKAELNAWLEDAPPDDVGAFCYSDMDFECGYSTCWDFQALQQIECIRLGAEMALATLTAERAEADGRADEPQATPSEAEGARA